MLQHKFCKYTFCLFFLSVGRKNTMELNVYFLLSSQNKAQLRTNSQKQKYKIRNHKQQLFTFYLFPQIQAKQKRGRDKDRSSPASHLSDCCGGGKLKRKQETKYLQTRSKGALWAHSSSWKVWVNSHSPCMRSQV